MLSAVRVLDKHLQHARSSREEGGLQVHLETEPELSHNRVLVVVIVL